MRALLVLLLALVSPASAVMKGKGAKTLKAPADLKETIAPTTMRQAVDGFNAKRGGGIGAAGFIGGRPGGPDPSRAAGAFLAETRPVTGIDPQAVTELRRRSGRGHHHVLYQQTFKGVPVEFSSVKVHLDDAGNVLSAQSRFRTKLDVNVDPSVSESMAAYAAKLDGGVEPRSVGKLVIWVDPASGQAHLAWKFTLSNDGGLWRYYVDAHSGKVLFRYDDRRYACPGGTGGTVRGLVYDLNDQPVNGPARLRAFPNQRVYIRDANTWADTASDGSYCSPTIGKVFTQLQGPYVRVSNFRAHSSHYDNSGGLWFETSAAGATASSPHDYTNNLIHTSTINLAGIGAAANAVKVLPVFSRFEVGDISGNSLDGAEVTDDDQVQILDASGTVVAAYLGSRGGSGLPVPFNGAAVPGKLLRLRLKTNGSGTRYGYDVSKSSYLVLNSPTTLGVAAPNAADSESGSFDWYPSSHSAAGNESEINLFYHLNKMRDYFAGDVNASGFVPLTPVTAMAMAGPDLVNAFYDPDYDDLFFGDFSNAAPDDVFATDATVSRHEYVHFAVEKIWPLQNFGQAGAISEAVADYFSASSLNHSSIGTAVWEALGHSGPLRELNCPSGSQCFRHLTTHGWIGEIHDDSAFVSQALWDLRKDRIARQGPIKGASCADNLLWQALLFFPESFAELQDAMTRVDASGAAPTCAQTDAGPVLCGGDARGCVASGTSVATFFANHGIEATTLAGTADPYDTAFRHNNGFETAIDISTQEYVSGTISPTADLDFFTFGAGPGFVTLTLDLPPDGSFYKAYALTVYNRQRQIVATAEPDLSEGNSFFTEANSCEVGLTDCLTRSKQVKLTFYNESSQQLYVQVAGAPTTGGSNSGVQSSSPYTLRTTFQPLGAVTAGIVTARLDGDVISFSVPAATFTRTQEHYFAYAQLRDHTRQVVPNTITHKPALAGDYLLFVSSQSKNGLISGSVQLASGFGSRFPAIGTVSVEVFAYNVQGSTISLGLSNALNLTTGSVGAKAYNNVFNPLRGQKTTIRYDVPQAGNLTMKLYTLAGAFVATVYEGPVTPGKGSVDWNGRNSAGSVVASGVYLLRVEGPGVSTTAKVAVVK